MRRITAAVFAAIIIYFSFSGCGKQDGIEFVSGEIVPSENESAVSFTFLNNTGRTIYSFSAVIRIFTDKDTVCDEQGAVYPIEIENGAKATLTVKTDKECTSAKAVSYSYKTENKTEKSGELSDEFTAYIKKDSSSSIMTREQLAEKIIRDVNSQFLKKGSLSTGSYDADKKRLVIVSKYKEKYEACLDSYERNPDMWTELVDGIIQMSRTCQDEFKSNNFDDVDVSVGIISRDEEIMFSATNGELAETLDSQ